MSKSSAALRMAPTPGDVIRLKAEAVYVPGDKAWRLVLHGPEFVMEELRKGLWQCGSSFGGGQPYSIHFKMEASPFEPKTKPKK